MRESHKLFSLAIFILLLCCGVAIKECNKNKISKEEQELKLSEYKRNNQEFKILLNDKDQELSEQKEQLINKDKSLEKELLKNTDLKKLTQQIKFESETQIKNIEAKFKGVNNLVIETENDSSGVVTKTDTLGVKIGTQFSNINGWYRVYGRVVSSGILFDSIYFRNRYVITVGKKRETTFGKLRTYVEVFNENPYTRTVTMGNIKVIEKKPVYQSGWLKFGVGVVAGALIFKSIK